MYLSINDLGQGPGLDDLGRWGTIRKLFGRKKKRRAAPAPAPASAPAPDQTVTTTAPEPTTTSTQTSTPVQTTPSSGASQTYVSAPLPMMPQVESQPYGEPRGPGVIEEGAPAPTAATASVTTQVMPVAASAESKGGFPWLLLAIPAALIALKK